MSWGYFFLDDPYNCQQLESLIRNRKLRPDLMKMFRDHSRSGKEYFETIVQAAMLLNHGLAVMLHLENANKCQFLWYFARFRELSHAQESEFIRFFFA